MTFANDLLNLVASRFGIGVAVGLALFLLFYFTQNRAARLGGWLSRLISRITSQLMRAISWYGRKRVERRLEGLVKRGLRDGPFTTTQLRLKWADERTSAEAFFRNERVIIRLPTGNVDDHSIVDAAFLFVSKALLPIQKRYLSNSQRQALDLYVTGRMIAASSPTLRDDFVSRFQSDFRTDDLGYQYLREFERLQRYGLFDEVLLRELEFLGSKALPPGGDAILARDVDALLQMLARLSRRDPGELINLTLERRYVRCGVVLVGKSFKVANGPSDYINYVHSQLASRMIDSVYLLAAALNEGTLAEVVRGVASDYAKVRRGRSLVLYADDNLERCHVELRTHRANVFTPDGESELMALLAERTSLDDVVPGHPDERMLGSVVSLQQAGMSGRIKLDDPAFDVDVFFDFPDSDVPEAFAVGDKVSILLSQSADGNYWGESVRMVLRTAPLPQGLRVPPRKPDVSFDPQVGELASTIDLSDVRTAVRDILAASDVAVPLAAVANDLMALFGDTLRSTGWLGQGSLKPLLRKVEVGEIYTPSGTPGWLLDPKRHVRPEPLSQSASMERGGRSIVADRICAVTGAPKLSSAEAHTMFEALEKEFCNSPVAERDVRELNSIAKAARDRCEDEGTPVTRLAINFVVHGYRLSGDLKRIGERPSAATLAELYRNNLVSLCGRSGVDLTPMELAELDRWLLSEPGITEANLGTVQFEAESIIEND